MSTEIKKERERKGRYRKRISVKLEQYLQVNYWNSTSAIFLCGSGENASKVGREIKFKHGEKKKSN